MSINASHTHRSTHALVFIRSLLIFEEAAPVCTAYDAKLTKEQTRLIKL